MTGYIRAQDEKSASKTCGACMVESKVSSELSALSNRLDELLRAHASLRDENIRLRAAQEQLAGERAQLLQKNEQARSRVEAMITRLKAMEQAE